MSNSSDRFIQRAQSIQDICPALAKVYRLKARESEEQENGILFSKCSFCNNPFTHGNYSLTIKPKSKLTSKIERLLQRYHVSQYSLGKFQQKLVVDYLNGKNTIIVTCKFCKKILKVHGQTRAMRQEQKTEMEKSMQHIHQKPDVKSKKEKKKQRKKQLRIKRKERVQEEDEDAGLILPSKAVLNVSKCAANYKTSEKDKICLSKTSGPVTPQIVMSRQQIPCVDKLEETLSNTMANSMEKCEKQKMALSSQTRQHHQNIIAVMVKQSVGKTSGKILGCHKPQAVKSKNKLQVQQLSKMLKREQNKETDGSLADFLSTL